MKNVLALILLASIGSTTFASSGISKSQAACDKRILAKAAKIKQQAKDIIRSAEDQMDEGLDRVGDGTTGMSTNGEVHVAQDILDNVRGLQEESTDIDYGVLKRLCDDRLDVNKMADE